MRDELEILQIRFADERASHRRREAFLSSVVLHLLFIIFILVSPKFLSTKSVELKQDDLGREKSEQLGFLALPTDYQKLMQKPKTPVLSDKDRVAQGKAPKIDPNGLRAPYSEGKSKIPEQSAAAGEPKPSVAPSAPPMPTQEQPTRPVPQEAKQVARLELPQSPAAADVASKKSLREISDALESSGFSIKRSIEQAKSGGNYGQSGAGGEGFSTFDNRQPNFSVDQPTILSDTQGVDFGSWLRLIYYRVRDNWYSVIPELIRSGTKGKVVVIFDVRSDGTIENLEVVKSSGLSPYDRAAVSSLKLSEPFPNFPQAFKKASITLQFSYFYNIRL